MKTVSILPLRPLQLISLWEGTTIQSEFVILEVLEHKTGYDQLPLT
jgi:hypothetical protein